MKYIVFLVSLVFLIAGCSDNDVSTWSKEKCIKAGYEYQEQEVMNYRTGKYEIRGKCIEK